MDIPARGTPCLFLGFYGVPFKETTIRELEAVTNRYLKRWLGLTKSADPSVLYRKDKGIGVVSSVRTVCLSAQVNKEVMLCCSKDVTVRRTASRRREKELLKDSQHWSPARTLDTAIQRVTHKNTFTSQTTRQGLGAGLHLKKTVMKKDLKDEVR